MQKHLILLIKILQQICFNRLPFNLIRLKHFIGLTLFETDAQLLYMADLRKSYLDWIYDSPDYFPDKC